MRVLIVDDEVPLAESIGRALRLERIEADIVHDGETALWQAQEVDYDAIVLDVMLPRVNGFVVCRELRARGVATPILMLTAKEGEHDEAEALDTGADDYLRKPFALVVLLARLRALTRRTQVRPDDVLTIGALEIDLRQARCRLGGRAIDLTAREMAVLEALARRSPEVVSKQALLDTVWGFDFPGDPNIVEVYVGYLRRKLGRHFVQTVRGAGYRLSGEVAA